MIFDALSQQQDLLNKTETYLKAFNQKDLEEAITTLRPHAYDLYSLLSPSVITQANKHLTRNGKPEWDVTGSTSSKEFYDFFKLAISVAHTKQTILMGHETETLAKSPSNRVFLTNNERASGSNRQQRNENHSRHKSSSESDPPPSSPPPSGVGQPPPPSGAGKKLKNNCKYCQAMVEENIKPNQVKMEEGKQEHIIYENSEEVLYPERCAYFMKLGMDDRIKVLKRLNLCTQCAASDHRPKPCWTQWNAREK